MELKPNQLQLPTSPMTVLERRRLERTQAETFTAAHPDLKEATRKKYLYAVLAWLRFLDSRTPTPELVREYGLAMKQAGLRPRTRHGACYALTLFFSWIRRSGLLKTRQRFDIKKLLDPGKLDAPRKVWATDEDIEALWQAAYALPTDTLREEFVRARACGVLAFCCYSGLRRAAILGIEMRDLDREATPWTISARVTKGEESHWVPLPSAEHFQLVVNYWIDVRERWAEEHGYEGPALFPVDVKRRLGSAGITAVFTTLLALAGIKKAIRTHAFRRWYATQAEKHGGAATAQMLLGHSHISTTYRYLQSDDRRMQDAVKKLPMFEPADGAGLIPKAGPNGHGKNGGNGAAGSNGHGLNGNGPNSKPPPSPIGRPDQQPDGMPPWWRQIV